LGQGAFNIISIWRDYKMTKFNFGKVFVLMAAAVAVFTFVFLGCDHVTDSAKKAVATEKEQEGEHTPGGDDDYDLDEDNNPVNPGEGGGGEGVGSGSQNPWAAINFQNTVNNSSGDGFSILTNTPIARANETWTLNTVEKAYVYFAVTKTADQTITASGTDAAKVTVATSGNAIDGSTPDATLAVVTVDARDFDTQFDGGEYKFTLTATQSGETVKTINVTLESGVDTDSYGVTIFKAGYIDADGNEVTTEARGTARAILTKQDAKIGGQISNDTTEDKATLQGNTQPVDNLYDANRWLTHSEQVASGTANAPAEWLVRLNKDQSTKPVYIFLEDRQYVTVRLRGAGSERKTISPTITDINIEYVFNDGNCSGKGMITVGDGNTKTTYFTLKLENVTLDGLGGNDGKFFVKNTNDFLSLVRIGNSVTVIMDNATITNFNGKSNVTGVAPVYLGVTSKGSKLIMKNNSRITGNKFDLSSDTSGKSAAAVFAYNTTKANFTFERDATSEISGNTPDTKKVWCGAATNGGELYN
jgi:hypothetical protein